MKLDPYHPYSSTNKGRTRNFQYSGKHDNGLIERGDDKLSTLVTTRPWLFNTMDVSPITYAAHQAMGHQTRGGGEVVRAPLQTLR